MKIPEADLRRIEEASRDYAAGFALKPQEHGWYEEKQLDFIAGAKKEALHWIEKTESLKRDFDEAIAIAQANRNQLTAVNQENGQLTIILQKTKMDQDELAVELSETIIEKDKIFDEALKLQSTLSSYKVIAEEMAKVLEIAKRQAKDRTNFERFDSLLTRYSELTKKA